MKVISKVHCDKRVFDKFHDANANTKRKLLPFIPDLPYHIQCVFLITFGYIWWAAFQDRYLEDSGEDPASEVEINRANWWRGVNSCVLFLCAFSYLNPYHLDFFDELQRFWRVVSMLVVIYFCLILILLNHRPAYGRFLLGYIDRSLNQAVDKSKHTYDDNCDLTYSNFADNFDHYYIVHLTSFFLTSFVIRNFWMLHFWHMFVEVIELCWQHILPHFRECWWDHLLVDILLSNIPAI